LPSKPLETRCGQSQVRVEQIGDDLAIELYLMDEIRRRPGRMASQRGEAIFDMRAMMGDRMDQAHPGQKYSGNKFLR
jgi:hypothetical protein